MVDIGRTEASETSSKNLLVVTGSRKELEMPTKQGDTKLLNDPVAQELLHSNIPARLAYVWQDGTP